MAWHGIWQALGLKTTSYSYLHGMAWHGMANVNVCILRHLKEELAWAIDKWLWVISNKMLFKTELNYIYIANCQLPMVGHQYYSIA